MAVEHHTIIRLMLAMVGVMYPRLNDPRFDELRKAVLPDTFVDCDRNEYRSCNCFVGVDRIGGRDGWKRYNLDFNAFIPIITITCVGSQKLRGDL
jgi:hypothetical protein